MTADRSRTGSARGGLCRTARPGALLALCLLVGSCVESGSTVCAGGLICGPGSSCDEVNGVCADPDSACFRVDDERELPCGEGQICRSGACVLSCGDGAVNGGDECEGNDVGGQSCDDFDRYAGVVACSQCTIDTSGCYGFCGDASLDDFYEACDPTDPREVAGVSCVSLGFSAGRQGCARDCGSLNNEPCMHFGWRPEDPFEIPDERETLQDIWRTSDDVYVLMSPGGVRSAAQGWAALGGHAGESVIGRALWASSSDDVWVIGASGDGFFHWNGSSWTEVASPAGGLREIWGSSATDVFAVGDGGLILHHAGDRWAAQATPPGTSALRAIWGIAGDEVYAVGDAGALLRYDGRRWSALDSGTAEDLAGIWALSGEEVWTVGAAAVRRHDGKRWTEMLRLPAAPDGRGWIGGTGGSDVWISAGEDGTVRRYDGAKWTALLAELTAPQPLWVDRTDVLVGAPNPGLGVEVRRWDGAGRGPNLAESGDWSGVWAAASDAWIATGADRASGGLALHADGSLFAFEEPLLDVGGFALDRVYALGTETVFRWDGAGWSVARPADDTKLRDLWTSGSDDVYVLASVREKFARLLHFDGQRWTDLPPLDLPCGELSVPEQGWASSPQDIIVVGDRVLARFDGSAWSHEGDVCDQHQVSVWGSGPGDVWVSQTPADEGAGLSHLLHWDGAAWSSQVADGFGRLIGTAADDVFLSGHHHYDGRVWSPLHGPGEEPVYALPSTLFLVNIRFEFGGLGQFIRTRFWNQRQSERDCRDGVDDDGDGFADRDDRDCTGPSRAADQVSGAWQEARTTLQSPGHADAGALHLPLRLPRRLRAHR